MSGNAEKTIGFFIGFIIVIILLFIIAVYADNTILPSAAAISSVKAKAAASETIDNAIEKSINDMDLRFDDFFIIDENNNLFSADTVLINKLCLTVNRNTLSLVKGLETETVSVPLGAVSGFNMLAASGPEIKFKIRPYGEATTDYETEIVSAGINQVSVKIWLITNVTVQVIHPLSENKVTVSRKVVLIDTVIKGEVPGGYMGIMNTGE